MLLENVTFYATTINGIDSNWVQIVTRSPDINTIFLDGQNIGSASFIPLPFNTSYSYTNLSIEEGAHNIITTGGGFLAYQVGLGNPTSNGCAAGVYISCAAAVPVVNFQSSATSLCSYNCISYTDMSTNATSWQWSFPGGIPSSSTMQNPQCIYYDTSGTYNATLIASNSGGEKDTLTIINLIHVLPSPPTPVIIQHNDTLYCTTDPSYTSYQWYDSTTIIPGATHTFLVVTHGGNYNVAVTNEFGCKISVGITIAHDVGINEFSANNYISLYPNPASDQLLIHTSSSRITGKAIVSIINVLGEIIQEEKLKWTDDIIINIKSLPAGMYFLQMKTESAIDTKRFVKLDK
jgi:PKD repeat protein